MRLWWYSTRLKLCQGSFTDYLMLGCYSFLRLLFFFPAFFFFSDSVGLIVTAPNSCACREAKVVQEFLCTPCYPCIPRILSSSSSQTHLWHTLAIFYCYPRLCLISSYHNKALREHWHSWGHKHVIGVQSSHNISKTTVTFHWFIFCLCFSPAPPFPVISSIKRGLTWMISNQVL